MAPVRPLLLLALLLLALATPARPLHDFRAVDAALAGLVQDHGLPGASLRLANGQGEVHRLHLGDYDDGTRVGIASASKWLSALTLARLVEAGELRWDSRVGEFFPEAPLATQDITLAQLFSHTSGIDAGESACLSRRDTTLQRCALDILAMPLLYAPGTAFAYGGNSMQVAGAMTERATGRSWDTLFLSELVAPLGLQDTDWSAGLQREGYVANPNPRIGGGARSTLDDYGRVLDMVLAGGDVAGQSFLAPASLATMAADRAAGLPVLHSPEGTDGLGYGYGLGQWVEARDARGATTRVSSPGAFGFTPWVDWRQGSSGIVLVHGNGRAMRDDLTALALACIDALDPPRHLQSPPPPASTPTEATTALDAARRAH